MDNQDITTSIAILTKKPNKFIIRTAQRIKLHCPKVDVRIISDCTYKSHKNIVPIISILDEVCIQNGYVNSTHVPERIKNPCSWDKAIYYYSKVATSFKQVWFIEDDVLIPDMQIIKDLVKDGYNYDLITKESAFKKNYEVGQWTKVKEILQEPFYYSMTCAMGISRNLLNWIEKFVEEKKTLVFHEFFFTTIAHQNKFRTYHPDELKGIYWKFPFDPNNLEKLLYHPVKDVENHYNYMHKYMQKHYPAYFLEKKQN